MNLDAVVGILVAVFAAETFGDRCQGIGQAGVLFHLGTLFRCELAFACDVLIHLIEVDVACAFVQKAAGGVKFGFHNREHLGHCRELNDSLAKLPAILGVLERFAPCQFANAYTLCCDAKACAVHESHHILDKAHTTGAAQFGWSVLVHQLACGRTFDAHLVFDTTYCNAAIALVVDEHRQTTAVLGAFFGACKHEVYVAVAVGDEPFHTVEYPCAVLFLGGFEHYALQVGTGIGFGEVHTHGFALAYTRDVARTLVVVAKLIECFRAVLKSPEVLEACVGAADYVSSHYIGSDGEVQAAETTGHGHAHQTGLAAQVEILHSTVGIVGATVGAGSSLVVHSLGIGCDGGAAHFTDDFEYLVIVVHGIGEIAWSVIVGLGFGIVPFS